MALPLKVFEVSDVVFKDDTMERKARNQRNMAAVYTNKTAGFEVCLRNIDKNNININNINNIILIIKINYILWNLNCHKKIYYTVLFYYKILIFFFFFFFFFYRFILF